jgi:hypothetical protein
MFVTTSSICAVFAPALLAGNSTFVLTNIKGPDYCRSSDVSVTPALAVSSSCQLLLYMLYMSSINTC